MNINFQINGKGLLAILAISVSLATAKNYVSLADVESNGGITVVNVAETSPIGTIAMWGTETPPKGWIEMNGQNISSYPKLAEIYPSGIPDMRGQFVRGWDNGAGIDTNRRIASNQTSGVDASRLSFVGNQLPNHNHVSTASGVSGQHAHDGDLDGSRTVTGYDKSTVGSPATTSVSAGKPTGRINSLDDETRPLNIALMYIIKAE